MKLYLVTRRDLPAGAQAAQLCHAMRAFTAEHPAVDQEWYVKSNTLVLLEAKDEVALRELLHQAREAAVPVSEFLEPDYDNALTALALGPAGRPLVRRLPLALRG